MIVDLNKAIEIVKNGGILIYPTDTAFGIGCRIDDEKAVEKLFNLRKRPTDKAVPALFASIGKVKDYVLPFEKNVEDLMKKYWPGALTIVLKCKTEKIPNLVRGGGDSLGVRIPNYDSILDLISAVGVPLVGTSANFAGQATPFKSEDLDPNLISLADGILIGRSKGESSSTVIDCTQKEWKILRQGSIKLEV